MNKYNFYQKKYEALETFYGWIDQGGAYDIAAEQSVYYKSLAKQKHCFYKYQR